MSSHRPYLDKIHSDTYRALGKVVAQARKSAHDAGLTDATLEIVNMRVSQINGCLACLSIHAPGARKAGVTQRQLDILPAWREAQGVFSELEYAALELAEATTSTDHAFDRNALIARVSTVLTIEQISAIQWAAILIGTYNRVSVASGHPPLPERTPQPAL